MKSVLSGLLNRPVTSIERIGGGRNSRVYRLTCSSSSQYAAKLYFRHSLDDRDRLEVEFSGLQFLWENGVRRIPRPIAADREYGCAIYEYIEGKKLSSQEVTDSDIDDAVQFLARLKEIKNRKGSRYLSPASEACFSVQAILNNIESRCNRLSVLPNGEAPYKALHAFLTNDFIPSFDRITRWCKSSLNRSRLSFTSELPYEEWTLSPSDFGFHNALRRSDGQIVFLDFEYFGWDDPVKMISDFLLHPAMELRENLKQRFVANILDCFENRSHVVRRIEIVYPLFGLKWCLIFLNEFVPEHLLRRGFASKDNQNIHKLQMDQLAKSRQMLHQITNEYKRFPLLRLNPYVVYSKEEESTWIKK